MQQDDTLDANRDTTLATIDSTSLPGNAHPKAASPGEREGERERGRLIGRYVVLARLGAGAMGIVYAAYDPQLDRKVALKLLKAPASSRSAARTRLHREAQALAKLDHRNVVGVHDVGVHEGQLFVGMEFVEGQTLGAWMAAVEQPRPWQEVVRVFMEAGRGLAAAHQAGLVHRDFKPDNVMLGVDGRVRVMDFGLARGHGDELESSAETPPLERSQNQLLNSPLTQTGTLLGTPAYMSLEQFRSAPADARSDQFGFCVALYQGLYGERPFSGTTLGDLIQSVETGKIQVPSTRASVPAWLRKVIVRGLAPNPSDRWPSMAALLEALADDPAVRRRRWMAAAGFVAALGGGALALVWAVQRDANTCEGFEHHLEGVWDEGRRAEVEAAILGTNSSYAPDTWARVQPRLDDYAAQWVAARAEACEATHRGEQSGEALDLRMRCLDERLHHLEATVDILASADETVTSKAVSLVNDLPTLDRCADLQALAAELPPPEDPSAAERVVALGEQLVEAEALEQAGKYPESRELVDTVIAEATELGYEPLLVRAWLRQGSLQTRSGEWQDAEATLERAYDAALGLGMTEEAATAGASMLHVVGYKLARFEDARHWQKHLKPIVRRAGTLELQASYLGEIGIVAQAEAQYDEARKHLEQAVALRERAVGPEHPDLAVVLNNLGTVEIATGNVDAARRYWERTEAILSKAYGPQHPSVATVLMNLGGLALSTGDIDAARDYQERGLAIREQALGPEHPEVAQSLNNLGIVAASQGNMGDAQEYHERALAIREKSLDPEHPEVAESLNNLANVVWTIGKHDEALGYFQRALAIREKTIGPNHPDTAGTLLNLAYTAEEEQRWEDARNYHQRALTAYETSLGPTHPMVASALLGLGGAFNQLGKPDEAIAPLERVLAFETIDPRLLADGRFELAKALWDAPPNQGRDRTRARELAEQARAAYAEASDAALEAETRAWQAEHGG